MIQPLFSFYRAGIAPYVSEAALRYAIDNDIMNPELMLEVLQAHPDVLRHDGFLTYLEENSFDLGELEEATTEITSRTELEFEIIGTQIDLTETYRLLIGDLKNDFEYQYLLTELPALLTDQGTLTAMYNLANFYFGTGQTTEGAALMESIPSLFTLNSAEEDLHDTYNTIHSMLTAIITNQQTELTNDQVSALNDIREVYPDQSAGITVSAMLTNWAQVPRTLCINYINPSSMRRAFPQPSNKISSRNVNVYPNPAKDHVVFSYDLKSVSDQLKLTITDIRGMGAKEMQLTDNKGVAHWYTNEISDGVYFYEISGNRKQYKNGKVIIMK